MVIHKYGPDTSSSQLGIKNLGTRVLRANGHGSRSCIVVCCVFYALSLTCCVICLVICMNNIHGRLYMEPWVRKHNLRGSKNKMNMIARELVCISVWHYAPLRKKG